MKSYLATTESALLNLTKEEIQITIYKKEPYDFIGAGHKIVWFLFVNLIFVFVIGFYADVLTVIAEMLSEQSHSAAVDRVLRNGEF